MMNGKRKEGEKRGGNNKTGVIFTSHAQERRRNLIFVQFSPLQEFLRQGFVL